VTYHQLIHLPAISEHLLQTTPALFYASHSAATTEKAKKQLAHTHPKTYGNILSETIHYVSSLIVPAYLSKLISEYFYYEVYFWHL
jgi:hypothetical protein